MAETPAVMVDGLTKAYGAHLAVDGLSFSVDRGEVFGLLGPNGAGKTTAVEILEGYRKPDGGSVAVLGVDPQRGDSAWRERIGIVLQSSAMYLNLTVGEHVRVFARYYAEPRDVGELTGARVATEMRYGQNGREVLVETHEPTKTLHELTGRALADGVELESLEVRRPTLEEIYLSLTGDEPE